MHEKFRTAALQSHGTCANRIKFAIPWTTTVGEWYYRLRVPGMRWLHLSWLLAQCNAIMSEPSSPQPAIALRSSLFFHYAWMRKLCSEYDIRTGPVVVGRRPWWYTAFVLALFMAVAGADLQYPTCATTIPIAHRFTVTHSLTQWTAWPVTDRCAVQTSRSAAMFQPASALGPTSTSSCTPDPRMSRTTSLADVFIPACHHCKSRRIAVTGSHNLMQ